MNDWPRDLAQAVYRELTRRHDERPTLEVITQLFETMYFASLHTEEAQPITFHVVYIDPNNPDPKPPRRIVKNRWSYVPLAQPVGFSMTNLVKLAKASDPRTSSLAVYHNSGGEVVVWGLIDQGNSYHEFVNYNVDSGPERPGIFQASITGVGQLTAYMGYEIIAELRVNRLRRNAVDVLHRGPVYSALQAGIAVHLEDVRRVVPHDVYDLRGQWDNSLTSDWLATLSRLLIRIQTYRHGGAILITPDSSLDGLNVKYSLAYDRLRDALYTRAKLRIERTHASDQIFSDFLEREADKLPVGLYLEKTVADNDLEENRSELDAATWFISLLSRVDGLVLLTPRIEVLGFGVEIQTSQAPSSVYLAGDWEGTRSHQRELDYNHFGTRHRSMMRYCASVPGSIGFVISQDGDVRAMVQLEDRLVLWENIKLRFDDFVKDIEKQRK